MKTAFCLFEESGVFANLLRNAGFNVVAVDLRLDPPVDIFKFKYKEYENVQWVISHPPCTEFAVSGTRWWKSKPPELLDLGIRLVETTLKIIDYHKPETFFLENPVGRIESCVPTLKSMFKWAFDPCEFALYADDPESEAYTKKTILWGDFTPPHPRSIFPALGSKMHLLPPSPERAALRSKTPEGFARAFVQYNLKRDRQLKLNF